MERRLFLILLALTALMMVGCGTKLKHYSIYCGQKWDILEINDSTYFIVPKYEEYSTPYVLNLNDKDSCYFCKERRQKELKELVEQLKKK
jgi:hypothetical protein